MFHLFTRDVLASFLSLTLHFFGAFYIVQNEYRNLFFLHWWISRKRYNAFEEEKEDREKHLEVFLTIIDLF